jgi:hypothetical protein
VKYRPLLPTAAVFAIGVGLALLWADGGSRQDRPYENLAVDERAPTVSARAIKGFIASGSGDSSESPALSVIDSLPFEAVPPGARVVGADTRIDNGRREVSVSLESEWSPLDLEIFYTEELVKDWIVYRDTLTEGVGWSAVFLQLDGVERSLGVFAVIKNWDEGRSGRYKTKVSLLMAEEI